MAIVGSNTSGQLVQLQALGMNAAMTSPWRKPVMQAGSETLATRLHNPVIVHETANPNQTGGDNGDNGNARSFARQRYILGYGVGQNKGTTIG